MRKLACLVVILFSASASADALFFSSDVPGRSHFQWSARLENPKSTAQQIACLVVANRLEAQLASFSNAQLFEAVQRDGVCTYKFELVHGDLTPWFTNREALFAEPTSADVESAKHRYLVQNNSDVNRLKAIAWFAAAQLPKEESIEQLYAVGASEVATAIKSGVDWKYQFASFGWVPFAKAMRADFVKSKAEEKDALPPPSHLEWHHLAPFADNVPRLWLVQRLPEMFVSDNALIAALQKSLKRHVDMDVDVSCLHHQQSTLLLLEIKGPGIFEKRRELLKGLNAIRLDGRTRIDRHAPRGSFEFLSSHPKPRHEIPLRFLIVPEAMRTISTQSELGTGP